jgi:hypothetical protein
MGINKGRVATVAVAGLIVAGAGLAGAQAAPELDGAQATRATVTGKQIKNGTVRTSDLRDRGVQLRDLSAGVHRRLAKAGTPGPAGPAGARGATGAPGLANLESDGPYPGSTDLGSTPGQGDNSDEMVPNDAAIHTVWVQCAPGKSAIGGGFTLASDAGVQAAQDVQVVASEPTQVRSGAIVYEPIAGDAAGSFVPNGWKVDAVNTGNAPVTVRPHVICATVAQ